MLLYRSKLKTGKEETGKHIDQSNYFLMFLPQHLCTNGFWNTLSFKICGKCQVGKYHSILKIGFSGRCSIKHYYSQSTENKSWIYFMSLTKQESFLVSKLDWFGSRQMNIYTFHCCEFCLFSICITQISQAYTCQLVNFKT